MNSENSMLLYGDNTLLLEGLYEEYSKNPSSVSEDWRKFFSELDSQKYTNGKSTGLVSPSIEKSPPLFMKWEF